MHARDEPVKSKEQLRAGCKANCAPGNRYLSMSSLYSKAFNTRKASPNEAVEARHDTTRRRNSRPAAAACEAIAIVRLLVSRIAVLMVPYQILVFAPGGGEGVGVIDPAHRIGQDQRAENSISLARNAKCQICRRRAAVQNFPRAPGAGRLCRS